MIRLTLHISWKDKLISTIRDINPNCQLIVSTHSPSNFANGWENIELTSCFNCLKERGLTESSAYLYMQGHCVYDLLLRIGRFLLDNTQLDFEYEVLKNDIHFGEYPEIICLQNDLSRI